MWTETIRMVHHFSLRQLLKISHLPTISCIGVSPRHFRLNNSLIKRLTTSTLTRTTTVTTTMTTECSQLPLPDGRFIAYVKREGDPTKPGLIFCSGFMSSLNGNKALFLDEYAAQHNLSYVRFDYIGHPESSGTIDDFTVSLWKQNTLDVLDKLTTGSIWQNVIQRSK